MSALSEEARAFWRKMERRWMNLAQSYAFAERTAGMIEEIAERS